MNAHGARAHVSDRVGSVYHVGSRKAVWSSSLLARACLYLLNHLVSNSPHSQEEKVAVITAAFCTLTVPTTDMTHCQ